MKTRGIALALPTLFLLAGSSRAADDDAIKKEKEKLQGVWRIESMEIFGEKNDAKSLEKGRLTITGDKFVLTDGDKIDAEGTFKIVMVKGKMRHTDLMAADGKTSMQNIAEWIDADTFRTCMGSDDTRPTDFSSTKQNNQILMVFKREKKK
jgi:uncharacterized protein (TIGR03067 family)